jgi:hypothetical protein
LLRCCPNAVSLLVIGTGLLNGVYH